ncbi:MAG: HAD family phosphatase [Rhizobiaceae bacterium]
MPKPLIIFDCDGVLVDTEGLANNRMAEIFTGLGFLISGHDCRTRFQGKSMTDVCGEISAITKTKIDPISVQNEINRALKSNVKAVAGVEQLVLDLAARGYPICVASSGSVDKMHTTLGQTKLLDLLKEVLFTASDVERGKPFPDVFEYAAQEMKADINTSIIIEDSLSGVIAGVSSGARTFGYCGDPFTNKAALKNAGAEVFDYMSDMISIIET